MGMLIEGRWVADGDRLIEDGEYVRAPGALEYDLPPPVIEDIAAATGRYVLVASMSCPWSHRVLLARALKGLEHHLPLHIAGGPRIEGYAIKRGQLIGGAATPHLAHVHQLYASTDPGYTGRATVPVLWDIEEVRIVSNASGRIMRGLDLVDGESGFTFNPEPLRRDIEALNETIYSGLANAVYRAGLAQRQGAYDDAVNTVFDTLSQLEKRLAGQRYLFGPVITEADWRLFATLVRFDAVYATHFRCTRARLADHTNLWNFARDLYGWRKVAQTVDFDEILRGYYINDADHNPHHIVAERPHADWRAPHDRARFGPPQIWSRQHGPLEGDPATLLSLGTGGR